MILVTGGNGFLGRRICNLLKDRNIQYLSPERKELDLESLESVENFFSKNTIKNVIHTAGYVGGIGFNVKYPGTIAYKNLIMGANIINVCAKSSTSCYLVIISTVCAYPENAAVPTKEEQLYEGYPASDTSFYGLAKRSLHSMALGFSKEFGLRFSYIIPTNLYGENDHFTDEKSHVVPAIIKKILNAKYTGQSEVKLWGTGLATRDLLYVGDCAEGLVSLIDKNLTNEIVNFSSGMEVSIQELAHMIAEATGFNGKILWDNSRPSGAQRRALSSEKALLKLGFSPRISLKEGIFKTVRWAETNWEDIK